MNTWWAALSAPQQVLWFIAVFSTVVFAIQMLISLVAGDHGHDSSGHDFGGHEYDSDLDTDSSHDHSDSDSDGSSVLGFFTVRNIVAFLVGFSWGGLGMFDGGSSAFVSLSVGAIIGIALVALNLGVLRALAALRDAGNVVINDALGHQATVSVLVPAKGQGYGKVSVIFKGRQLELEAFTQGDSPLPRGNTVIVDGIRDNRLVVSSI